MDKKTRNWNISYSRLTPMKSEKPSIKSASNFFADENQDTSQLDQLLLVLDKEAFMRKYGLTEEKTDELRETLRAYEQ